VIYQLLGPHDADIDTGSISILSPVGNAIQGLTIGEKASGKTPRGEFHYEVIDIAKSQFE
jgi:transcription elongation factor GreA